MSRRITARCKGVSLSITTAGRTELRFGEGDLTELVRIDRGIGDGGHTIGLSFNSESSEVFDMSGRP